MNLREKTALEWVRTQGLPRYRAERPGLWRQNRVAVTTLRRNGAPLTTIIAQTPWVHDHDDELAAAVGVQWALDATRSDADEEQESDELLLHFTKEFELARRRHHRLVTALDPRPLAEMLAEIELRLPAEERDDRPAIEQAREYLSCHNGLEGVTQHLRLHGYDPDPVLARVYGPRLAEIRALERRLEVRRHQRDGRARELEACRLRMQRADERRKAPPRPKSPTSTPQACAAAPQPPRQTVRESDPALADTAFTAVPPVSARPASTILAVAAPPRRNWPECPNPPSESEIRAAFAAAKKDMLRDLRKAQTEHPSLLGLVDDTPKPPSNKFDDRRACTLVRTYLEKAIGLVAEDEKAIVERIHEHAHNFELLRRTRDALVTDIDPQPLAELLERNNARRLSPTYPDMAKRILFRPDCVKGLRAWMAKKGVQAQPVLDAIFGDRLTEIEDLEQLLMEACEQRKLAAAELEHLRLSRGVSAYGAGPEPVPDAAEREVFQQVLVRVLDRRIKVQENGKIRLRTRRELVIATATKLAGRHPVLFEMLRRLHARGAASRPEDEDKDDVVDVRALRLALCEEVMRQHRDKSKTRSKSGPYAGPMRRMDDGEEA